MKKKSLLIAMATIMATNAHSDVGDLLITELAIASTSPNYLEAEFVEIYNNGATTIDLSDVYLTDATFRGNDSTDPAYYYEIVKGNGSGGGGGYFDFHARFPNGATIQPGSYQTVSINGSIGFVNDYGVMPTYELYEDDGSADGIPDMREAFSGSINGQGGLTDNGEVIILYTWDGTSDLVEDLDYIVWGDKVEGVDKTGISIDSATDGDSNTSSYLPDTDRLSSQTVIATVAHALGNSWQRSDLSEGNETNTGGNGVNGHDETSENTDTTFLEATPTPNAVTIVPPPGAPSILINEVDAVGTTEFVEIYDGGIGNTSLDDVKVVFFDGATDLAYDVYDLTGMTTDVNGYFLLGNATTPSPDITLDADSLQDGADAVAIYFNSAIVTTDSLTSADIIDAFVYGSDSADDIELLALLNAGQLQVNENSNGLAMSESNARCQNGSGGILNTSTYQQVPPTPGNSNSSCSSGYYIGITPAIIADPTQLKAALHNLIDDHVDHSYSTACDIIEFADADPDNPNEVWMLYSNQSFTDIDSCAGSYNREHTWPKSRFTGDTNSTPGQDAHHLMATNKDYNSRRGNLYFDDCLSGCTNTGLSSVANNGVGGGSTHGQSNWRDSFVFEVWDYRKGDVARAMFYMAVRYEGDSGEPDMELTDDTLALMSLDINFMGKLSTLCEWHYADPVDANDITRNEAVFSYQENRNPFVDHPEWVEKVFASVPACQQTVVDLIFADGFE